MNLPPLAKKKPKWDILCRIHKDETNPDEKGVGLSFTTNDFKHFIPPNGDVTDFNIYAELGFNYPKLKPGIYTDSLACCLITETRDGICLHGISHDLQKIRDLISKILSSAGMRPRASHYKNIQSPQQLQVDWSEAILALAKK